MPTPFVFRSQTMSIEVRPLNVKCNIACEYCYQNNLREAKNLSTTYNLEAMKATLQAVGHPFAVFGGEPLLLGKPALEELFRLGYQQYGRNVIQTNGTLIDDDHIRLFRQYNVHIGISLDGPGELNIARWAGSLERTRTLTAKTEQAIARLLDENLSLGLIITLHRGNAAPDKLPTLIAWIRTLSAQGVGRIRLHLLEADSSHIRQKFGLTTAENLHALTQFEALEAELGQKFFDIFDDMKRMLGFQDYKASCVWRGCDSYNTEAVQSVNHLGLLTNCGRTTQDGVDFLKADDHGYERYLALYHTPHEHGGCQDCRFFLACKGYCPGTAIHNDWRNRTEYCDLLTQLFERVEAEMVAKGQIPLSLHPERVQRVG
ncbi:MAG TPA: radical SAM protein, partial [Anaerolineales bacterium]|nr:radical SAM protein [Anaerolineales bacterium]